MQEIFGKDGKNRFILIYTFADDKKPLAFKVIRSQLQFVFGHRMNHYDTKEEEIIIDAKKQAFEERQKNLSYSDRLPNDTMSQK